MADMALASPPRRLRALLLRACLMRRLLGSATLSATTALASSSISIPIAARPCARSTALTSALLLERGGAIGVWTLACYMALLSAFEALHGR